MSHIDGKSYVSGSVKRLRKRLQQNPDRAVAFKDSVLDTVSVGMEDFEQRLRRGEVKVNSIADYERLVKLGLLSLGEATDKIEHTTDIEEISDTQFDSIKDTDEFKKMQERLYAEMNKANSETK